MFSCQSCRCCREHKRRTWGHRTRGRRGWRRCSKGKRWRGVGANGIQSSGRIWEQASAEGTLWFIYLLLIDSRATAIYYLCVDRFTECCPSGSHSLTWFTETLKATWFLSLMFRRFRPNSLKSFTITEFSTFSQVSFIFAALSLLYRFGKTR